MDHKRGHGSLDHSNEQSFTRVKRHKDQHQQPTNSNSQSHAPQNTSRSSRLQFEPEKESRSASAQRRSSRGELATVEQLRAIAEKSAKSVNILGSTREENHKTVEQTSYEKNLPILLAELSVQKAAETSRWPEILTDRRMGKRCAICKPERNFKGWEALLIHAAKFQKENTHQHRGYYRALREALLTSTDDKLPVRDIGQGPTSPHSKKGRCPRHGSGFMDDTDEVVETDSPKIRKGKDRPGKGARPSRDPQLEEVLAVYSTGRNHHKKKVVVIPATEVGPTFEAVLLQKASCRKATEPPSHSVISRFMEERWPGAKTKKYSRTDAGVAQEHSLASTTSSSLCTTVQIGRPGSPKEKSQNYLEETDQKKQESEELQLCKPLEEHRNIFNQEHFGDRVQSLVSKWKGNFQQSKYFRDDSSLEHERRWFQSPRLSKGVIDRAQKFEEDVGKYAYLDPSSRKEVKKQMTVLEDELRKDKLVWLQEIEAVRDQFQALADTVHNEQIDKDEATMQVAKYMKATNERMKNKSFYLARKMQANAMKNVQSMHNVRRMRARREQDVRGLMQLWREEQRIFETECRTAKQEKQKLVVLHDKIHAKAKESQKECPICLETWDLATSGGNAFGQSGFGSCCYIR